MRDLLLTVVAAALCGPIALAAQERLDARGSPIGDRRWLTGSVVGGLDANLAFGVHAGLSLAVYHDVAGIDLVGGVLLYPGGVGNHAARAWALPLRIDNVRIGPTATLRLTGGDVERGLGVGWRVVPHADSLHDQRASVLGFFEITEYHRIGINGPYRGRIWWIGLSVGVRLW